MVRPGVKPLTYFTAQPYSSPMTEPNAKASEARGDTGQHILSKLARGVVLKFLAVILV
jgi:hypothetical protein